MTKKMKYRQSLPSEIAAENEIYKIKRQLDNWHFCGAKVDNIAP
jgi:hypothetical protein